ncbi:DNA polymerase III subunit epsilon [Nitrosovibrio sp. Nv6]|uniref:DNA polymerase III subunit epsilon n=1 Tax=Nitrosovibrio sp. Nv6 TaxID=1855340 RepID=UPI0008B00D94|nr:DNA polymerase III subunit epsilon [Nitrosovibrio sp. Nv6]SEO62288.1 DNA polymerase-3 subunit epsilon [Nitrosovibrio sp. Nv6]
MRQIFIDTETTGLEPKLGHRIIEIAAVEMLSRRLTGRRFHCYLNPGREIEDGALQVHGLTTEFLQDKQKFHEVVHELLEFIDGAELIMHNAAFDVAFLDHELGLAELPPLNDCCHSVTDTLKIAKDLHPGKRNNLDALCERYQVDNSRRALHGALLDAELLAEVYLAMTRGQDSLLMDLEPPSALEFAISLRDLHLVVLPATDEELEAHAKQLESIERESKGKCLWKQLEFTGTVEAQTGELSGA